MKIEKMCPQCSTNFIGRSNQLYCSDPCKIKAFRAGQTHKLTEAVVEINEMPTHVTAGKQSLRVQRPSTDKTYKVELEIRRLELEHERKIRQMEIDKVERGREHERALAKLNAETINRHDNAVHQNNEIQKLTKQVSDLKWQAKPPLDDWIAYPIGIRLKYKALVQAAFTGTVQSVDNDAWYQWLVDYKAYINAVQDLINHNDIPSSKTNAFVYLEELSKKIDLYRLRHLWAESDEELTLDIHNELRERLIQACI